MKDKLKYTDVQFTDLLDTGSAIAGAAARKYLYEKGGFELMRKVLTSSNGILVKTPAKIKFNKLMSLVDEYLDIAVQNKLINKKYAEKLREGRDVESIKEFLQNLRREAIGKARPMLRKMDLKQYSTLEHPEQTEAMYAKPTGLVEYAGKKVKREGYVITMSELAYNRAKQINSGVSPKKRASILKLKNILILPEEIPDLAFVRENQFKEVVEQITESAPKALEKIVGEI